MRECLSRENEAPPELHLNRVQGAQGGQTVDAEISLSAELRNPIFHGRYGIHFVLPKSLFFLEYPKSID